MVSKKLKTQGLLLGIPHSSGVSMIHCIIQAYLICLSLFFFNLINQNLIVLVFKYFSITPVLVAERRCVAPSRTIQSPSSQVSHTVIATASAHQSSSSTGGHPYIKAQVLAQDGTGQLLQMRNAQYAQTNMTIDTNRQLHDTILDPYSLF